MKLMGEFLILASFKNSSKYIDAPLVPGHGATLSDLQQTMGR